MLWRAALALSIFATFQSEVAYEIVSYDVHNVVAENFHEHDGDPKVQQQMLWLLGNLLKWPRSTRRINASPLCMELFVRLRILRENLIKSKANTVEAKYKPYEVVAPIEIREFLRVSGGKVVAEKMPEVKKEKKKFKKRKAETKGPKFGTVEDQFKAGEPGLI